MRANMYVCGLMPPLYEIAETSIVVISCMILFINKNANDFLEGGPTMAKRFTAQRRDSLVQMVLAEGFVSVADAARRLGVSGETIRKDLIALDESGVILKSRGGAVAPESVQEVPVRQKAVEGADAKAKVAKAALALVPEGGTVLLDAGTSTLALARLLALRSGFTVFTNSVSALECLTGSENEVFMLGGRVRPTSQAAVGSWACRQLESVTADVAFMGTDGFTSDVGPTTKVFEEAEVKRRMVASARKVVVLADGRKFGAAAPFQFVAWDDVDVLVTDAVPEGFDVSHIDSAPGSLLTC